MILRLIAGALALALLTSSAHARRHEYQQYQCVGLYCRIVSAPDPHQDRVPATWGHGLTERAVHRRPFRDGRPHAWCGWQMRQWFGGGPEFNLARAWARRGSPTSAHVGAVVVWPHHVGYITGQAGNGMWIIRSGNDGNAVRERARSIVGAIALREL